MKIGIVCYASLGGSGVVATELARALALRDHDVHLISSDEPFRWRSGVPGLTFERIETPTYPLFREPQYLLALTNAIVRISRDHQLDVVHAHYAVPHATAAYLADQILTAERGPAPPRMVTTLHGTDITLVGSDPSYARVVAFSIEQSHAVTAVSNSLRADTIAALRISRDIRVIPNFLDCAVYRRRPVPDLRARLAAGGRDRVVMHASNFRPVKRVGAVVEIFRRVRERVPARLVLIGDGPDREAVERHVVESGLQNHVDFVGEQHDLAPWLSAADLFLLPSQQESFGLAALEAMACDVPVVASRVGGLGEIIDDGTTGYLCAPEDLEGMVERAVAVLSDPELRDRIGRAAAAHVTERFCADLIVPQYEQCYRDVLADAGQAT
ncbi:MAG TPA: N-acetyl-alpha-D-glucosaminyl L-malate synthase BshA [Vicinamibacterales bacterium]|jgi:N-acetyl-alpha-D-glucosaminyl L-malate synthase BshA|nr:N-acetyl-alpha-D-glucosaminyl L-malate synthase BshA [Vicinamibacterales bacterium]